MTTETPAKLTETASKRSAADKITDAQVAAKEKAKLSREKSKPGSSESANPTEEKADSNATQQASLTLAISPWGDVFVDGNRQGVSPPLRELSLTPGKHTILIVNETFKPYSQTIELAPGGTFKIKYKFPFLLINEKLFKK